MRFIKILLFIFPLSIYATSSLEKIFDSIYHNNIWGNSESVSGSGSTLDQTQNVRNVLLELLKELDIKILLDTPCGDFNWMRTVVDLSMLKLYIGVDIVKDLIEKNKKKYEKKNITFYHLDISRDFLPDADLIFCRDVFQHIKYEDIFKIIKNFKKNSAKYLLASTYAKATYNLDRENVDQYHRSINLQLPPFNFPKPLLLIDDFKPKGKYIGLWELESLPDDYFVD